MSFHEFTVTLLLTTTFCLSSAATGQNDCVIPLGSQADRFLPLIASRDRGVLYPIRSRAIAVRYKETVDIICTGRDNTLVGQRHASVTATCQRQGRFNVAANFVFKCTKKISEEVKEQGESCGSGRNSKIINIGWNLGYNEMASQVKVCFNPQSLSTEYSKHKLTGLGMTYKDSGSWTRPQFRMDSYFSHTNPSISTAYTNQLQTVAALLNSTALAAAYVNGWGSESYLARGHLSPDADFSLRTWQYATYHYINAVPMWQAFNNGNWKDLEGFIRTRAKRPTPRQFEIYTGTHGVLKLPDVNDNLVSIFLLNEGNQKRVPVPEYIWKVVIDRRRSESFAFVLLNHPNNPRHPIQEPPPLCPNICHQIPWVTWRNRNDKNKGKIYCCTLDSLRISIPNIPVP